MTRSKAFFAATLVFIAALNFGFAFEAQAQSRTDTGGRYFQGYPRGGAKPFPCGVYYGSNKGYSLYYRYGTWENCWLGFAAYFYP